MNFNWWKNIHVWHHELLSPSPFAADAVHPFEAILQVGHFVVGMVAPVHPLMATTMAP